MGRNKVSINIAADTSSARQQINNFSKELNQSKRSVRDLTAAYEQLDDATKIIDTFEKEPKKTHPKENDLDPTMYDIFSEDKKKKKKKRK